MSAIVLQALLDASIRASVVAAAVALILCALRIRANGARHVAWTLVLCGMLLMPFLPYGIPVLEISVPQLSQRIEVTPAPTEPVRRAVPTAAMVAEHRPSFAATPAPQATSAAASAERSPERGPAWSVVALALYGLGALLFFARFALGWRAAHEIARASQPIAAHDRLRLCAPDWRDNVSGSRPRLCESAFVATPVTLGLIAPAIILPATWRDWSNDALRAILSHECAHVRRKDPLVNVLAHLNRCVFWFHPLAWWLTHKLAAVAEHACDDAGVRAVGDGRRYAQVLVDMAALVQRNGGRLSWHGAGIDGDLLSQRIDRVISGGARQEASMIRTWGVAASCVAAIVLVVACRRQPAPPIPLRNSLDVTEQKARQRAEFDAYVTARDMSASQVAALEVVYQKNSEDLVALKTLLIHDWVRGSAPGAVRDEQLTVRRRARILWLINHHADSELAGLPIAVLFPFGFGSLSDPPGLAEARPLWLAHTNPPGASAAILGNAARFFEATDGPLTEELLLRARAKDPQGPWLARLGQFYADTVAGRFVPTSAGTAQRDVAVSAPQGAFAESVRRKLAESSDDGLLIAAAARLLRAPHNGRIFDPPRLLALPLLRRAVDLNPGSVPAHADLVRALSLDRSRRVSDLTGKVPLIHALDVVSALPDAQRLDVLLDGNGGPPEDLPAEWKKDPNLSDRIRLGRTVGRTGAEDLLRMSRTVRDDRQGTAIYFANMTLASMALIEGDRKAAVTYLLDASHAPASEELAYSRRIAAWPLVRTLLEQGERASVIEFLERMANTSIVDRASLRESAAAIRGGDMPNLEPYWTAYYPSAPPTATATP